MNKFKIISLFLVILVFILIIFFLKNKKCTRINCLIFNHGTEFVLSDTYEDNSSVFRALYQQGSDTFLRIESKSMIQKADSAKLLASKISHLSDIFENSISPYPGEISVKTSCADQYKPKFSPSDNLPYFIGYLNDRLQFGSCSEDQVKNQGAIGFLYCPDQKRFFQIEYIVSIQKNEDKTSQIKEFIESIKCKE